MFSILSYHQYIRIITCNYVNLNLKQRFEFISVFTLKQYGIRHLQFFRTDHERMFFKILIRLKNLFWQYLADNCGYLNRQTQRNPLRISTQTEPF